MINVEEVDGELVKTRKHTHVLVEEADSEMARVRKHILPRWCFLKTLVMERFA